MLFGREVLLCSLVLLLKCFGLNGDCVWYDQCGFDNDTLLSNSPLNCKYDGPPIIDEDSRSLLQLTCPHLLEEGKGLCCSVSQLTDLLKNFKIPEIMLGRCPVCFLNFKRYFCDMVCHPDQSSFIKVTEIKKIENAELVKSIEYNVNEKFLQGIYDSCSQVWNPSTSSRVLRLMCGRWGDELCTPLRWFSYLGDKSNGRTPIQIDVLPLNDGGHDPPTFKCNSNDTSVQACACLDCKEACPTLDIEEYEDILKADEGSRVTYGVILFLSSMFLMGISFLLALKLTAKNKIGIEITPQESSSERKWRKSIYGMIGKFGRLISRHALSVLFVNALIFIALSIGIYWLEITSEPIELWSSPSSRSRQEREFFNEHFEPFFRTSIVIIRAKDNLNSFEYHNLYGENVSISRIFKEDFLYQVLKLQKGIESIVSSDETRLFDLCYKPLAPEIPSCLTQSIWNYWQDSNSSFNTRLLNENGHMDTYLDHLTTCVKNPYTVKSSTAMGQSCLSKGFVPLEAKFVMGGYAEAGEGNALANSSALILTFLLQNHVDPEKIERAVQWEKAFIKWMQDNEEDYPLLDLAFIAEMSIQDAIESNSRGDVLVVIISYSIMFFYVAFALTDFRSSLYWGVSLAVAGIVLVLASILSATGLFGYLGVKATLIIFEIVPFLVLAVGIDNIFVLSLTTRNKLLSLEGRGKDNDSIIGETLEEVAPGMITSTLAQAIAFYLGTLSKMPAVTTFSIYAGTAILINFMAQITGFVAVLSLDLKRIRSRRVDVFYCIKRKSESDDESKSCAGFDYQESLSRLFKDYVAPLLLKNLTVKFCIIALVILSLSLNLVFAFFIPVGLDPESTMPEGSYVKKYFEWLKLYYSVGPPVYFIVNSSNIDLSSINGQNKLCGSASCGSDSFITALKLWSTEPDLSTLATSGQSWIDDYFSWSKDCCRVNNRGEMCLEDEGDYASAYAYDYATSYDTPSSEDSTSECSSACSNGERINGSSFRDFLDPFLSQNPSEDCPKGGKIYKSSIYQRNESITYSSFMAFHSVLRTSDDFVRAIESTRALSDKLMSEGNITSFPYSIFHVYYEQYLTMKVDTLLSLTYVLLSCFLICWILSGKLAVGLYTLIFVGSVLINVLGFISLLGIQLNAILAVNLLVACGISVEICIGYLTSVIVGRTSAEEAFRGSASVLFSGIHITNIIGVSILGFSNSNIFFYYFFVVYMSVVVIGFIHGIIVLPVLLSFFY